MITGSREVPKMTQKKIEDALEKLHDNHSFSLLLSGGATGVDQMGEMWAKQKNIAIKQELPNWKEYGKSAGVLRNQTLVNEADIVVAFWNGRSKGTKDAIQRAVKANKIVKLYYV